VSEPVVPPPRTSKTGRERLAGARRRVEDLRASAEARLETERERRSWVRLVILSWERDRGRAGGLLAGGLAYRVFLWQLAAALVMVAVTSALSITTETDPGQVMQEVGMTASVATAIGQAASDAGTATWWLLLLGAWGMLWAGRGAARAVQVVSRIAFEDPAPAKVTATRASLTFNAFMLAAVFTQAFSDDRFGDHLWGRLLLLSLSTLGLFALLVWSMSLLPHRGLGWRVAVPGAALCTVGLVGMRIAIDVYFADRIDRALGVYGPIGIAVVILLALYLTARLFVFGIFGSATFAGVGGRGESFDVLAAVESYGTGVLERRGFDADAPGSPPGPGGEAPAGDGPGAAR
jgi:uncharacterized BrkB/YihY/UPF0761 family membrane protein